RGQWLHLDPDSQTCLGREGGAGGLGASAVAGERVWDLRNKIRLRVGPLSYGQFLGLLPDRTPAPGRKAFFLLTHLVRLYVGPELDFDVQLILGADDVPESYLGDAEESDGARLGWNTWVRSLATSDDADDAVFEGDEVDRVDGDVLALGMLG